MIVADVDLAELCERLAGPGLFFRSGPFSIHLRSDLPDLPGLFKRLYADYPLLADGAFADFHVRLYRQRGLRRWWRPQVQFQVDDEAPFFPFPQDTALPFLEWGLNWCIASRAHQYLMLHAGALEKDGRVLLLPAWPGAGKSTLCAGLIHRGWRLLSDEFALVRPADLQIVPLPRPIALKNESIALLRRFAPQAVLGPEFPKTRKGTVAHLRAPRASVVRAAETAPAGWIVFPKFQAGALARLYRLPRAQAFVRLSGNAFNYELSGLRGFQAAAGLIESCDCYQFSYPDLESAVAQIGALTAAEESPAAAHSL